MLGISLAIGNQVVSSGGGSGGGTSSATLTGTTGTSKSQFLNVASPFYQYIHNASVGTICPVRATASAVNTKHHLEWKIDHLQGQHAFGYDDNTIDYNLTGAVTDANLPGNSVNSGVTLKVVGGGTWSLYANGTSTSGTVTLAANDYVVLETDSVAKTISYYKFSGTTATLITSITLTSKIPATWWAFGGGANGDGTVPNSDAATFNPGKVANAMTPNTGFNNIYA